MKTRRREFIALVAGAALTPLLARAEQRAMKVVGFLHSASLESSGKLVAAFKKGLFDAGFIDGENVAIEYRWAEGQIDRLPDLVADLIERKVAVIATPGSMFAVGGDPVALGLVASLNQPGGNVTGIGFETTQIAAKALGILHEVMPHAARVVTIVNPELPFTVTVLRNLQEGAATLGLQVEVFHASTDREIAAAFADVAQRPGTALLLGPDPFYTSRRLEIVALAARYALPTMYVIREFVDAGGLISYGPDLTNAYRETGTYTGRILKGEKPADLPVVLPTKFQLVINRNTANALGLAIPDKLLALADDVIEN